jgi:hypothetical protein
MHLLHESDGRDITEAEPCAAAIPAIALRLQGRLKLT